MEKLEIIELDYKNKEHLHAIGDIHGRVLPGSNVPGLGKIFMNHFYYSTLSEKGLLKCYIAKYNNNLAGLLVTTRKPYSLIKKGLQGNYIKVALILGFSILLKPTRLKSLFSQLKYKADPILKKHEDEGISFEVLTIGVVEEYRSVTFPDNKKIAHKMVEEAMKYYKREGFKYLTGQILKENPAPQKFWSRAYKAVFYESSVRDSGFIMVIDLENI